ncbi:MAG TPA: sulfotransferase domain-containing protein [Acetobacteraceae bacterium]|nr:sulfotransferase domain-containing protein [Acetobacteraceae bacterium]
MDSRIWNDFRFRDGDVVVATYAKSGTTWMQQIVSQLLFDGEEHLDVMQIAPWLESRIFPKEQLLESLEAQQHRRSMKTHLPADALVYSPSAKYIYVARDGRDVCWSLYNHHMNMSDEGLAALNERADPARPRFERPSKSVVDYFREWLEKDGYPFWSFWDNVRSWWSIRHLPNLLMVHHADLKADLPGEMRRVAEFLDIHVDHTRWPTIVEHCTFDYMRRHGSVNLPRIERMFIGGAASFIYKGTNGRWRDELSPQDLERYEMTAEQRLGAECAAWLAHGRLHPEPGSAMN